MLKGKGEIFPSRNASHLRQRNVESYLVYVREEQGSIISGIAGFSSLKKDNEGLRRNLEAYCHYLILKVERALYSSRLLAWRHKSVAVYCKVCFSKLRIHIRKIWERKNENDCLWMGIGFCETSPTHHKFQCRALFGITLTLTVTSTMEIPYYSEWWRLRSATHDWD